MQLKFSSSSLRSGKPVWETPRQACDQERRGGVALELGTSQPGSTTASELIPPLQVGMSRGDRGRGVPNPTSLSSPTGPEKRLLEAITDDRRIVKCSVWMREENGREKGEERTKFFPLVSERLVGVPCWSLKVILILYIGLFSILAPLPCFFQGMVRFISIKDSFS